MRAERPEKVAIREKWVEAVVAADASALEDDVPLYLTLCGAEGRDIESLVKAGLIHLTEVGALSPDDVDRVIAVEKDNAAVLELQRRLPGLKIQERAVETLIQEDSPVLWPEGEELRVCRAKVVNLDFNGSLVARLRSGKLSFPAVTVVEKLATLHSLAPPVNWTLCLTLNSNLPWNQTVSRAVQRFMAENFGREETFATASSSLWGRDLYDDVLSGKVRVDGLNKEQQQKILMALVPKAIASRTYGQGWRQTTKLNLRYGGTARRAAMVTWIIDFAWDPEGSLTPDLVYLQSLSGVLSQAGRIKPDGAIA